MSVLFRVLFLAWFFGFSTSIAWSQRSGSFENTPSSSTQDSPVQELLSAGIELEKQREWVAAIQHYESATRAVPDSSEIRRRLLISRLHYDVVRRGSDSELRKFVQSVSPDEALDLYSDVVARLETNYVESLEMTEVVRGGTAYLEVALTEPQFLQQHLSGVASDAIEEFRTSVHKITLAQKVRDRMEAKQLVARAARAAESRLGLKPTTTILQFVLGAVGLLDPYSTFLSPADLTEVESQIEGNFVGLGIALQPHQVPLEILDVIPGGPAEETGLKAGDSILEVGSVRCVDVGPERAADLLRGPEKSRVRLLIEKSDGSRVEHRITRRRVEVHSINQVRMLDPSAGVAYLKLSSFQKTTGQELDEALWKLHRQGMQSLIVDVRGNPGGWLDAAVEVADRFLSEGSIVSTRSRLGGENRNYTAKREGTWQVPLALLIDDQSASASEILAGAIRDNHRGTLIGSTTYGKGSVQGLFHTRALDCGIRLTVSKFYSPSGRAISERGVEPLIVVTDDDDEVRFVAKTALEDDHRRASENHPSSGAYSSLQFDMSESDDRVLAVAVEHARTGALAGRSASRN
jgi:carboxyl-terminal processing protease